MTVAPESSDLSRRHVVLAGLGAIGGVALAACGRGSDRAGPGTPARNAVESAPPTSTLTTSPGSSSSATPLVATPECVDHDDVTTAQTEGPYFKLNSPERMDIRGNAPGTKLRLTGTVLTTSCQPSGKALVDFWQADTTGNYDNTSFGFRGHQYTDAQGRYVLETVVPGLYPGRTRHIHVKVQAPGGVLLTTQLYFPGEPRNASDGIYRKECEITVTDTADGKAGTFTFVVNS